MEKRARVVRICGIVVSTMVILLSVIFIEIIYHHDYDDITNNFTENAEAFIKNPYSGEMIRF